MPLINQLCKYIQSDNDDGDIDRSSTTLVWMYIYNQRWIVASFLPTMIGPAIDATISRSAAPSPYRVLWSYMTVRVSPA